MKLELVPMEQSITEAVSEPKKEIVSHLESIDKTIQKKPKEDPLGAFLERFGKEFADAKIALDTIDISYLTSAQRAESMWAVFQDTKHFIARMKKEDINESELQKINLDIGVLKKLYDDVETRKLYEEQYRRHTDETESINGNIEKYKDFDREKREVEKAVAGCARRMFAQRGNGIAEIDKLLFEANKKQLQRLEEKMQFLIKSTPELAGLEQYCDLREGSKQLKKENFIWKPSRKKILDELEAAAISGKPVLLSGESGTGKTRLEEQASLRLTGQISSLTPGKDTRLQDLIAQPKISADGKTYYEYKEIGEAFTGRSSTLDEQPQHQGRFVADDEFNLRDEADQTEILSRVASWTPGKKVRVQVTGQKLEIMPNSLFCAMVNLASERYTRKKIPSEVLRKFAKVDVPYLEQTETNPEIYESMLSALLSEHGRMRTAKDEIAPQYEFWEESKTVQKNGQEVKQTIQKRKLVSETTNAANRTVMAGGFLWRLAGALNEINKSFSHQKTVFIGRGEAQFLKDLIIDIGTIIGWMKEYQIFGQEKSLEAFFSKKVQKEFLSSEAYSMEDRQLVKDFFSHYTIEIDKNNDQEKEKPQFEIMTPVEIGLLSPRVHYEKVVNEEPVLSESYFIDGEGNRVEYRIESIEQGDEKFVPGQVFMMSGKKYEFLGVEKKNGDPVYALYKEKPKVEARKENAASSIVKAKWHNPETQKEQTIEINIEDLLAQQEVFYKNNLNIEINGREVRSIWNKHYTEIQSEIEKYGYDEILIVPDTMPEEEILNERLIETMEETVGNGKQKVEATWQSNNFKEGGAFDGVRNNYTPKYRLVLTHSIQNIEDHPLLEATRNKNVMQVTGLDKTEVNRRIGSGEKMLVDCKLTINGQEIEIKSEGFSLEEYIVQQRMYFDKTGEHLDKKNSYARLLKSYSGSRVVDSCWRPGVRQLRVGANDPEDADDYLSLRLSCSFSN